MVGEVWLGCKIDIFACMIPISPLNNAVEQAKARRFGAALSDICSCL